MKIRKLKTIKSSAESSSNQQCTKFTAQYYQSFPMLEKPTMCPQNITKNNHLKIELQTKIFVTKQTAKLHQICTPLCFCSVVNDDLKMVNGMGDVLKIFNHWQPLFFMPHISSEMNSLNSLCQTSGPALWWLPCKSVVWWKVFPDHLRIHHLKNIRHPLLFSSYCLEN